MIHALDYYNNQEILRYIRSTMSHIKSREEREDCNQEIFAELYPTLYDRFLAFQGLRYHVLGQKIHYQNQS